MTNSILWRGLEVPGHEMARVVPRNDGWELLGTALFAHEEAPCKFDYRIACGPDWHTRSAHVDGLVADRETHLKVLVDAARRWYLNGAECPAIAGCIDIDLGFSPSTNLLPIRRLALAVGEEAAVNAAWLPFPSLVFQVLPQVYRRVGETAYRYAASAGTFVRVLEVSPVGFVTSYPGLWQAEATART